MCNPTVVEASNTIVTALLPFTLLAPPDSVSTEKKGPRCYWKFNWLLLQSADFILDPLFQIKIFSDD
jgi:hypothetical protein